MVMHTFTIAGFRVLSPCSSRHLDYYFKPGNLPDDMKYYFKKRGSTREALNHSGTFLLYHLPHHPLKVPYHPLQSTPSSKDHTNMRRIKSQRYHLHAIIYTHVCWIFFVLHVHILKLWPVFISIAAQYLLHDTSNQTQTDTIPI